MIIIGLSLLNMQGCSLVSYARRREPIPPEYIGETSVDMQRLERQTRNLSNWLEDYRKELEGY